MRNAGFADAAVSSRERTRLPCPLTRAPIARAIILNDRQSSSDFLDAAARLCDDCGIRPIVLTVAKTEDEAGSRQRSAETVFQKLEAVADFDYVVGNDSSDALSWSARWRGCSHAFVAAIDGDAAACQSWQFNGYSGLASVQARMPLRLTITKWPP